MNRGVRRRRDRLPHPQDAHELHAAFASGTAADTANVLRSPPALESALERPRTYAHYQHADLALQAAVLAHGIDLLRREIRLGEGRIPLALNMGADHRYR